MRPFILSICVDTLEFNCGGVLQNAPMHVLGHIPTRSRGIRSDHDCTSKVDICQSEIIVVNLSFFSALSVQLSSMTCDAFGCWEGLAMQLLVWLLPVFFCCCLQPARSPCPDEKAYTGLLAAVM